MMGHRTSPGGGKERTIPLRLALTLPFVLLILLCAGLIGWFSLDNGRSAVLDVAEQLRIEVLKRVGERLCDYLADPHLINEANALALASGLLDLADPVKRGRYFYGIVATHPLIAYSFFGAPDGEFFGARRAPGGDVEIIHAGRDTGGASTYYAASPTGERLSFRAAYPNFDPRTRPWYKAGVAARGPVWSPVYRHFVLHDLTVTASLPVYDAHGALRGVFGVDYSLNNIHAFLETIKVGPSGEVFLMERTGELLAASTAPRGGFLVEKGGAFSRLKAAEADLPRIAAAAKALEGLPGGLAAIGGEQTLAFDLKGRRQFLQTAPFTDKRGIDWLIVAVVPEKDFMGRIDVNTRQTVAMIGLAVVLTAVAGVGMAARLTRPVESMARIVEDLSEGNWDLEGLGELDLTVPRSRELKSLALAFRSMAGQLKASFEQQKANSEVIALQNKTLEQRVQRRTEELNHLHNRLRAMFEAIPGYIHVIDKEFNVVDIGDKLLAALGKTREEVLGRKCHEVFHGVQTVCEHCLLAREENRGGSASRPSLPHEEAYYGTPLMLYSSPIRDESGGVWGYIQCLMDVSELRAAERELVSAKEQAERANHAKSEFLAKMSHDIRTPLNAILGLTAITLDAPLRPEQRDHLETVVEASRTLLDLINDLLDYSKIEVRGLELHAKHFSLPRLLFATVRPFMLQARSKGIELTTRLAKGCPRYFQGDPVRLRQILINLIGNAIKFTAAGSVRVTVTAGSGLRAEDSAIPLTFAVADTGIGVADAAREQIFQPFQQADASIPFRYGGSGLGLAICRQLAELMGGAIRLESAPGQGSVFSLDLALMPGDPTKAREERPVGLTPLDELRAGQRPLRILLAEDNPMNVKLARSLLTRLGHSFEVAGNGREAIKALRRGDFDLTLMDLEMPELDGLAAARLIRQGEAGEAARGMPIVALTAHALEEIVERIRAAGMNAFIPKPIDFAALAAELAKYSGHALADNTPRAPAAQDLRPLADEEALERLGGDGALLRELRATALAGLPQQRAGLEERLAGNDLDGAGRAAHALKSILATIGARGAEQAADRLEKAARARDAALCARLCERLSEELGRLEAALRESFQS